MSKRPFALIEPNFILNDPNYYTMSAPAKALYISLWCLAVNERSELVRRPSPGYIALMSSSYAPHASRILQECIDHKLVVANGEWVVVFGVSRKHSKINITEYPDGLKSVPELIGLELNGVDRNGIDTDVKPKPSAPAVAGDDPKPKKEKNPDIKIFIDHFFQEYQKKFNSPYLTNGKDAKAVQRALGTFPLDHLKNLLPEFLNDPLEWQGDHPDHTISLFVSQINRYGKARPKKASPTKPLGCTRCGAGAGFLEFGWHGFGRICEKCKGEVLEQEALVSK